MRVADVVVWCCNGVDCSNVVGFTTSNTCVSCEIREERQKKGSDDAIGYKGIRFISSRSSGILKLGLWIMLIVELVMVHVSCIFSILLF